MNTSIPPRPAAVQPAPGSHREAGAKAERERCRQIMTAPAARGREFAAKVLALETDVSAEVGIKILASLAPDNAPDAPAAAASWDDIAASVSTGGKR